MWIIFWNLSRKWKVLCHHAHIMLLKKLLRKGDWEAPVERVGGDQEPIILDVNCVLLLSFITFCKQTVEDFIRGIKILTWAFLYTSWHMQISILVPRFLLFPALLFSFSVSWGPLWSCFLIISLQNVYQRLHSNLSLLCSLLQLFLTSVPLWRLQ